MKLARIDVILALLICSLGAITQNFSAQRYCNADIAAVTKAPQPIIDIIQSYVSENQGQHFYVAISPNREKMAFVTREGGYVCIYDLKTQKKQYCDLSDNLISIPFNTKSIVFRNDLELALLNGSQLINMSNFPVCTMHTRESCSSCKTYEYKWFLVSTINDGAEPFLKRSEFLKRENGHLMFYFKISDRYALYRNVGMNLFSPLEFRDNVVKPKQKQIRGNGQKKNEATVELPFMGQRELSFMRPGDTVEISNDDEATIERIGNIGLRRVKSEQLLKTAMTGSIFLLATKLALTKWQSKTREVTL